MQKITNKGFTIIETMIVLAIAGLIMLIVFMAVPALQRSSRNTSRKNDAGNISSAISNFISNNNGSLPASPGDLTQAITGIKLGYYLNSNVFWDGTTAGTAPSTPPTLSCSVAVSSNGFCSSSSSSVTPSSTTITTEDVIFVPGYTCSNNMATQSTPRSYVVLYAIESGSSSSQEQCIAG